MSCDTQLEGVRALLARFGRRLPVHHFCLSYKCEVLLGLRFAQWGLGKRNLSLLAIVLAVLSSLSKGRLVLTYFSFGLKRALQCLCLPHILVRSGIPRIGPQIHNPSL